MEKKMKYQITRTDLALQSANSNCLYNCPDSTELVGESNDLVEAIIIANNANKNRTGYSGTRVIQNNNEDNRVVSMVNIPLATIAVEQFGATTEDEIFSGMQKAKYF